MMIITIVLPVSEALRIAVPYRFRQILWTLDESTRCGGATRA